MDESTFTDLRHPGVNHCSFLIIPVHGPARCRLAEFGLHSLLEEISQLRHLLERVKPLLPQDESLIHDIDEQLNPSTNS